jgi:hypothetical protein
VTQSGKRFATKNFAPASDNALEPLPEIFRGDEMKVTAKPASDKDGKRMTRAFELVKQVVEEVGIRDSSEYIGTPEYFVRYWVKNEEHWGKEPSKWPDTRWSVFKCELARDVLLLVQVNGPDGTFWIETSLLQTAVALIRGAEMFLSDPQIVKLMGLSDEKGKEDRKEKEKEIEGNVRDVLRHYLDHLPAMMAQSAERAHDDCIERQMKCSIEPRLRDYWRDLGLPGKFSLVSSWNRDSYANQLDEFREIILGKAKPKITRELPAEYDSLRLGYKKARDYYDESKAAFLKVSNEGKWLEKWRRECDETFPRLGRYLLRSFCEKSDPASELALKHLETNYGRSKEYLRKRISQMRNERPKSTQSKKPRLKQSNAKK